MKERNLGVDLLRMVCMYMICLLHVLGMGGVLLPAQPPQYKWLWLLEMSSLCAANCYAMISGYVGWRRKSQRYAPLAQLWLQTAFWGIMLLLPFLGQLQDEDIFRYVPMALLPITRGDYWYLTAYVCLYFVLPLLNRFLQESSPRQLAAGVCVGIVLFSVVPTISQKDLFGTLYGYSPLWLGVMYVLGGAMARLQKDGPRRRMRALLAYAASVLVSWMLFLIAPKVKLMLNQQQFFYYTQPLMVCAAASLVQLFSGLRIRPGRLAGMIRFFAPLTFGVYIIHLHPLVKQAVLDQKLAHLVQKPPLQLVAVCLGYALVLYVGSSLLDAVRRAVFVRCKVDRLCAKTEERIRSALGSG